jgi:hypothetical protein
MMFECEMCVGFLVLDVLVGQPIADGEDMNDCGRYPNIEERRAKDEEQLMKCPLREHTAGSRTCTSGK